MYIHKTHSKKNLRELFKELGYDLNCNLNKRELTLKIRDLMNKNIKINEDNSYNIKSIGDLINHLNKPNYNEKISIEKKKDIMLKAKRIIQFAKNGYNLDNSFYNSIDSAHSDTVYISAYGFLPTVRRACNLYNECMFKIDHVNAIIPVRIQKELNNNKIVKKTQLYNLKMKRGKFVVSFD